MRYSQECRLTWRDQMVTIPPLLSLGFQPSVDGLVPDHFDLQLLMKEQW